MSVPTVSSIFSPAAAAVQTVETTQTSSGRGGHLSADLDPVDL